MSSRSIFKHHFNSLNISQVKRNVFSGQTSRERSPQAQDLNSSMHSFNKSAKASGIIQTQPSQNNKARPIISPINAAREAS